MAKKISVMMNAGLVIDMPHLEATGADGVGLFRTELQFLIGNNLPSVETQQSLYSDVVNAAGNKPVIFRTADLGGDKSADYMVRQDEGNPAMGWRGLRMAIDRPGLLRPQLRALLSATAGKALHVMLPMVTLTSEIQLARDMLDQEIQWHQKRNRALPSEIKLGIMVETPASAWDLETIAKEVDFLSIGGNDLAQFYFAADRDTPAVWRRFDALNPGFLRFVRFCIDQARAANIPISYCGEQVSDMTVAAALLALGLRQLSVPATSVGVLRRMIRSMNVQEANAWLEAHLTSREDSLRSAFSEYLLERDVPLVPPA